MSKEKMNTARGNHSNHCERGAIIIIMSEDNTCHADTTKEYKSDVDSKMDKFRVEI